MALTAALGDPDFEIRSSAVSGLARLGSRSESALVRVLFSDPDLQIRAQAATALSALKSIAGVDLMTPLLRSKCWAASDEVAIALRSLGRPVAPALIAMLKDSDGDA